MGVAHLVAVMSVVLVPWAAAAETADGAAPPRPKKLAALEAKEAARNRPVDHRAWNAELDRRIGADPEAVINIYNTWTQEMVAVAADPKKARLPASAAVNGFLRCHFTNQPTDMDPRLFEALVKAARHFKSDRIDIVSGFRSPKLNLILRKKGREVARNSQHTLGHAVDFRVRGVSTTQLHKWARGLRLGGVGYYPSSAFIHIDVGPVRYWTGR